MKYSAFILPFTFMIVAIANGPGFYSCILENPLLIRLGEASYCVYIIHWSAITFIKVVLPTNLSTPLTHVMVLIATIPIAVFCHRVIETPMREKIVGKKELAAP